jgi:hypothetical protein
MVAIFSFPDDARWNEAEEAVQFSVTVGDSRAASLSRGVYSKL